MTSFVKDDFEFRQVRDCFPNLARNVFMRDDGSVWWVEGSTPVQPIPVEFNKNGKPFVSFKQPGRENDFLLWLQRASYQLFKGSIPQDHEVYPLNGNRGDFRPDNLALRPKGSGSGGLVPRRLPEPPTLGPIVRHGIGEEHPNKE